MGSVRGSSDNEAASCHNEFQAKMSSTSTLRYSLKLAKYEIKEMHVSLNETQDIQKSAKRKEIQLEKALISKQELVEALETLVQNFTVEVQELHSTCDKVLPIDCCQVRNIL